MQIMPRPGVDDIYRFTMNIPPTARARLMRAAALERTSLEDFMLRNSLRAAEEVIDQAERISLSERGTQEIVDLLDHPRDPNPNMVAVLRSREAG
jgi:uncharacterized protein (DUF1778 family)